MKTLSNIFNHIHRHTLPLLRDGLWVGLLLLLCSCSGFLEEEDKDQVIPRTVDQFAAMLHQHGYLTVSWFYRSDFMTDDIAENSIATTEAKNPYKRLYTWAYDVERTGDGTYSGVNNGMWANLYNDVLVANYVIERADDIKGNDATPSAINSLKAEAFFLRARAYLELVNIYATPYDAATAATTQGVPLRDGTGVSNDYQRASIAEVYAHIESDLAMAIRLYEESSEKKSLWHPNKKAALLLLSRVYLYKGEWQKVVDTTTELIDLCPQGLYAMNMQLTTAVVKTGNPEILHTYGSCASLVDSYDDTHVNDVPIIYRAEGSSTATFGVSKELLDLYDSDDCRPTLYFLNASGVDVPAKWHSKFTQLGAYSYRLSEAYLSRAEAYAALGNVQKAIDDLSALLAKRIDGNFTHLLPDASDALAVRRAVLDERRRELCFENHRWYDLRRSQSWYPKDLTHVFTLTSSSSSSSTGTATGTETYTLRHDSPNYTFELPKEETEINASISLYGKRE